MIVGTEAGNDLFSRSRPTSWDNPMWDEQDVSAGGIMPGEGQLLYGLVRAIRPGTILEVGTSHGYSTIHLAAGCRDNARGMVHTVETHEGRRAQARANIADAGLSGWVKQYGIIPGFDHVDLVFLDAGHKLEDVKGYLAVVEPMIGNGLVVIHDAMYQDHVRGIVDGSNWHWLILPGTSYAGIALLTKAEGRHADCGNG